MLLTVKILNISIDTEWLLKILNHITEVRTMGYIVHAVKILDTSVIVQILLAALHNLHRGSFIVQLAWFSKCKNRSIKPDTSFKESYFTEKYQQLTVLSIGKFYAQSKGIYKSHDLSAVHNIIMNISTKKNKCSFKSITINRLSFIHKPTY